MLWALLKVGHRRSVGHAIEPLTRPLGFDWRINVGLIGCFGARELMVWTMGVIFGVERRERQPDVTSLADRIGSDPAYTTATALSLLAFFVLACQCMSTVAAMRRETKSWKVPAFVLAYTYVAAYVAAFVVHAIASRV